VAEGDDGRVLLNCFAGCSLKDIVAAVGREVRDLFPEGEGGGGRIPPLPVATVQQLQPLPAGCTLTEYAAAKKLDVDFLRSVGLSEITYLNAPAVHIPYFGIDGEEIAVRFRTAISKGDGSTDDRFRWRKGSKPCLYGIDRLGDAREAGYVLVVEGESCAQTAWAAGLPAVGLPGANQWREERDAAHLEGIEVIYVVLEPDHGGEAVLAWLSRSAIRDRARLVSLPAKDLSDLYLDDPRVFQERLGSALAEATPWAEYERAQRSAEKERAWEGCKELATSPAILDRLVAELRRDGLAGEDRIAKLIYLATTSRLLERIASAALKGPSAGGKSHIVGTVLRFLPDDAAYVLSAMSERALAYSDEPLSHRMLVIYEAAGLQGEFASYLVRSLLSEGKVRYETVEKTSEGLRAKLIEREGPTGLIVTTTAARLHPENETRLLSLTVSDTAEQTKAVLRALATGPVQPPDRDPWHALQRWLAGGETRVVIPFAGGLADLTRPVGVRLRRDFQTILTLIQAHALLHRASRPRDSQSRIVATLEDYAVIRDLVHDLVAEGVEATVPPTVRETIEAVQGDTPDGVSVAEIATALKLDKSAASRRVRVAIDHGYLVNHETQKGKPSRIARGNPLPDDLEILPTVEALQRCSRDEGESTPSPLSVNPRSQRASDDGGRPEPAIEEDETDLARILAKFPDLDQTPRGVDRPGGSLMAPGVPGFEGRVRILFLDGHVTASEKAALVAWHRALREVDRGRQEGRPPTEAMRADVGAAVALLAEAA
jgi:hypothetical protein